MTIQLPINPTINYRKLNEFKNWYATANAGSKHIYHHGYDLHETLEVENVRVAVWELAYKGYVYLMQKRDDLEKGKFYYIAQKASRRMPRLIPAKVASNERYIRNV